MQDGTCRFGLDFKGEEWKEEKLVGEVQSIPSLYIRSAGTCTCYSTAGSPKHNNVA